MKFFSEKMKQDKNLAICFEGGNEDDSFAEHSFK